MYMQQPPGFKDITAPSHVCLLRRTLYGLCQAPRAWCDALRSSLLSFSFVQSGADSSLFNYNKGGTRVFVLAYVNDLIITGSCSTIISTITANLLKSFLVKDLGPLTYFLGVEVARCKEGLFLS